MNEVSKFEGRAKSGYHVKLIWVENPEENDKPKGYQPDGNDSRCAFCFSKENKTHGDARL